jgi:pimeloyl-ACP methyl ester carboxylesterase
VHSVNAVASAAEVRPLHDHYRATRTVYSVDLPGFGLSDRSDRVYTPRLMTDAVLDTVDEIARRQPGAPLDALAASTGCEFLARAAAESPASFRSVALVSPTGFRGKKQLRGAPQSTRFMGWFYRALRGPGWSGALFRLLTRPSVIRYFLRRTWGRKEIDDILWQYDIETALVDGAKYAPLYFLAGGLFSGDIHTIYESLNMPIWMSHGVRGDFTDYRGASIIENRPNWRFTTFQTGALPYFEVTDEFVAAYDDFIASATGKP